MATRDDDIIDRIAEAYRNFAAEACGRSPQYEELALAVAGDTHVLGFLVGLPAAKRQPNLLFAAARFLLGEAPDGAALRALIANRGGDLAGTILARRTQTNEPARCATLLPAFRPGVEVHGEARPVLPNGFWLLWSHPLATKGHFWNFGRLSLGRESLQTPSACHDGQRAASALAVADGRQARMQEGDLVTSPSLLGAFDY